MKVRLLTLGAIVLAMACNDNRQPTGPTVPVDPSQIISDGAHCGNAGITCNTDFFFLPPMVPLPIGNPNFELGKFNNALRPSLKIDICELKSENLNAQGLPTAFTGCVAGAPIKTFAPGSVQLVNLPLRQNGWWTLFGLPPDGFYYVLWDTRQSNLSVNKYYRIKVFIDGISEALGVADVDPMANLFQWKYTLTGQVIQLVDDVMLPIPFRVEKGGGPAVCGGSTICSSATITGDNPTGDVQVLQTPGNNGPIAGAVFPDGWLPVGPGLPTSVVVTIRSVNTGVNDVATGTQQFPCHVGLPLQQFNGCFEFTTTPTLLGVAEGGHQFAREVTVVACFVLHDGDDPREPWSQLWSSGPNEPPHPLKSTSDVLVLTAPTEHACGSNFVTVIGSNSASSNPVTRLASAAWQRLKIGVGSVFSVRTAYAVDAGLGGLTLDFSRVGPAMTAQIKPFNSVPETVYPGSGPYAVYVRVVGTRVHNGVPFDNGIGGMSVTYTLAANGGGLHFIDNLADPPATQLTATTNPSPIASLPNSDGWTEIAWTFPTTPGTYTLTATGQATGGPVTFTSTVIPFPLNFVAGDWVNEDPATRNNPRDVITVDGSAVSVHSWGACIPTLCDWGITTGDISRWDSNQEITAVWDQDFVVSTQTITYLAGDRLKITTSYHFRDGRTDFSATEFFSRAPVIG